MEGVNVDYTIYCSSKHTITIDTRMLIQYPSILAHMMNGMLLFASVVFVIAYFPKLYALDAYRKLILLLLFTTALGLHGISHLLLEKEYHYNPLKW